MTTHRSPIAHYQDLIVWQKARALVREVYLVTGALPPTERFGLTQQLRRASVSVPSNIAEGHGRMNNGDYVRSLSIARGSLHETETLLLLSLDVGFLDDRTIATAAGLIKECSRMLAVMIRKLGRKGPRS